MLLPGSNRNSGHTRTHTQQKQKNWQKKKCTSSSVVVGKISTLEHELRDHAVEDAALVAVSLLSSAKSAEVLSGTRNVREELEGDALRCGVANLDVEEDFLKGE
jgi:hypothetical protein